MKDIFIGLMSGTSVDKVDAVAVYFDEKGVNLIGSHLEEIPNEIKKEILELVSAENIKSLDRIDTPFLPWGKHTIHTSYSTFKKEKRQLRLKV